MIRNKTVFIVGAGGSHELGFPMGEQLKTKIAEKVNIKFNFHDKQISGDQVITDALSGFVRDLNGLQGYIDPHRQAGVELAEGMPIALSIDNFLHTHAENEHLVLMGKIGIAASIMEAEAESKITTRGHSGETVRFSSDNFSWHAPFCQMLLENVPKSDAEQIFDNVSVITFNYDRCIEQYVAHALANQLRVSIQEGQQLASGLEVIHPYGQIGELPWLTNDQNSSHFGTKPSKTNLIPIAQQLRTFTEQVDDEALLARMSNLISTALLCDSFSMIAAARPSISAVFTGPVM